MEMLKEEEEGNYCITLLALNLMITFFDLPALQRKQRYITQGKSTTTSSPLPQSVYWGSNSTYSDPSWSILVTPKSRMPSSTSARIRSTALTTPSVP